MAILYLFWYNFVFRSADQVVVGSDILVNEKNELTPAKVIDIFNVKAQGKL